MHVLGICSHLQHFNGTYLALHFLQHDNPELKARINLCDRCSSNYTVVVRLSGMQQKGSQSFGKVKEEGGKRKKKRRWGGGFDGRTS